MRFSVLTKCSTFSHVLGIYDWDYCVPKHFFASPNRVFITGCSMVADPSVVPAFWPHLSPHVHHTHYFSFQPWMHLASVVWLTIAVSLLWCGGVRIKFICHLLIINGSVWIYATDSEHLSVCRSLYPCITTNRSLVYVDLYQCITTNRSLLYVDLCTHVSQTTGPEYM